MVHKEDFDVKKPQHGPVDYDRGVMFMSHPQLDMNIYMYIDTPGVYLTVHGHAVSDKLAREAGFDTEKFGKQRLYKERLAVASDKLKQEIEGEGLTENVINEQDGFKLVSIGLDRYQVKDADGNLLHPGSPVLTKTLAEKLFDDLVNTTKEK